MDINTREIAIKILTDINQNNAFSNIATNKHIPDGVASQDENFIREITYGVLENKIYIDYILSKLSKIKIKKIHPIIMEILRIGVYQILFMDRVPNSAAVNESVNLAKKYGHKGSIGFVNGVLRSLIRDKDNIIKIDDKDYECYLSIKYSHPIYMVKSITNDYGIEFTEEILKSNNERPNLNIRVNTLKTEKEVLMSKLTDYGFQVLEGNYGKNTLIIKNPSNITKVKEFNDGYFTIQDESSQLVSQIMNPNPNSFVLDVCSAPGGKATHMAQIMDNKGKILARDFYNHKIELINENSKRLGIDIIETEVYDAIKRDETLIEKVDYVLLDAPCSGLGLIRRKPEIRWNRKEEDIKELTNLQWNILNTVKNYVKNHGILVYSTCTILKEENINMINRFLELNKEFRLMPFGKELKTKENLNTINEGYIQLFPHIHGTDGFFIAKMIKEI
ncbi:16S rRNA (cytosine(967)-C(5))-methyltransferase RsmB [Paratissierella segnis]|jgi:16S rRNA (cytosine967-C5)-methyltransferase|uniref:16S rRNA (cytosine(967)-C(5))-methyltransferase n=1 Tax=Paratissierella segnis TaxID=2763679 RepID=A0A926EW61_9FIRM|nr:16S rRNA (cytosine(967)-C(5))-methyltransferase RsmB [Paratissierella segnis]MBC8588632.1 16S rRNA (cytosine(967)-C(5))-methyltransferase RsmB [Paratissierella segnis]